MRHLFTFLDWLRHRARRRRWNAAHALGRRGEDLAHRYLQNQGYRVIGRNLRLRGARVELDLVARDGDAIVFVEVKTRATDEFGAPDQAVDIEKRENIIRAASTYLHIAGASWQHARFDIVSITVDGGMSIAHIRDAFARPPI